MTLFGPSVPANTSNITLFMVFESAHTGTGNLMLEYGPTGATMGNFSVYKDLSGAGNLAGGMQGNAGLNVGTNTYPNGVLSYAKIEFHRSKTTDEVVVYVNGGLAGTTVLPAFNNTDFFDTALDMYIGGRSTGAFTDAKIMMISAWNKILSPTESAAIESQIVTDYGAFSTAF